MDNYCKGKNVEESLERNKIPIPNLPENFLWMQVRGGSKIRNLLTHAFKEFPSIRSVVWTGFGPSVGKAISCAEIMKREYRNELHQITKLCYKVDEEYWDPLLPDLDQIVVKRKLPMIHILLSSDPLDTAELGYQAPGVFVPFDEDERKVSHQRKSEKTNKTPTKELAALKMNSNRKRQKQSGVSAKSS